MSVTGNWKCDKLKGGKKFLSLIHYSYQACIQIPNQIPNPKTIIQIEDQVSM